VTIAFLLFIVAPFLVVSWISVIRTSNSMTDEIGRTTLQLVNQNHVTIEKTLSSVNDKSLTFMDNHFFSNMKQYSFWTGVETLGQISEADSILESWSSDGTEYTLYMKNVDGRQTPFDTMYKERGFKYFGEYMTGLPDWAMHAMEQGGGAGVRHISLPGGGKTIGFMRSIQNPKSYSESIGLLVVTKLEVLLTRDLVSVQLPEHAGLYLFNAQDELLMKAGPDSAALSEIPEEARRGTSGFYFAKEGDGKWLYAFSRKPAYDTTLVYKIPYDSITGNQSALLVTLMALSALYLVFVLAFVLYLLRIVVKPLVRLVTITKLYEPGKSLDIGNEPLRADEFGILYGAFLKMTKRLDQSFEDNYGMQIKQKEYELSMLHSQITPHLLYNTLDSIYWYALDSGNTDVGEMVKDLSKLLRIGLSKGRTMITIGEELEHVQAYSRLQMKRYPDTFEVEWDIDEKLLEYTTPKVIMQPLVENAIFHGVSTMDGEGVLRICIRRGDGDELLLIVEDNGFLPVDMERLAAIVRGDASDKGYGIRNVHQRVQLHYGEAYGLRYEAREGGGLRAVIHLPLNLIDG
jgi:two-component system sensor histidine kinase YesM